MEDKQYFDTKYYWDYRYTHGEGSGTGSEGIKYKFKRDYINAIIEKYHIQRIIDFGCGDGMQVRELNIEYYHGIDIAERSAQICRQMYTHKPGFRFDVLDQAHYLQYDLAMSLDVLYHVVNQEEYESYLKHLFQYSIYTLIYANWDEKESEVPHIYYRNNIKDIERLKIPTQLIEKVVNIHKPSVGFMFYQNK